MSPEIIFDPYAGLYSVEAGLLKSSEIRDLMSIIGRPDVISFAGGLPYIEGLPPQEVAEVMAEVMTGSYTEALQYGETEGWRPLKLTLAKVMAEEGIKADPEHILITTGSQQALDLLSRIFIDRGDNIVIEGPTYLGALSAFRPNGPRVTTLPLDDDGLRTDLLETELKGRAADDMPKFIYVVPTFQNPGGVTMSEERRQHLLALVQHYDILLVEDNPYGLLRFEGEPIAPLAARGLKKMVYFGTLSKIVSPGIRVGWAHAPAPIIERMSILKQSADLCSSTLTQMFADAYLKAGLWKKNLANLAGIYHARRDAMLAALEEHFPDTARWTRPEGGLFIWVTLPEYLDTSKMLPLAIERKVAYVPGIAFYADGPGANQMRLNFSFADEEKIAIGIERLGEVIAKEMSLYHSLGLDRARKSPPESAPPRGGK